MKRKEMEGVIEAILFTMGESVELSRIAKALEEEEETVRNVIHQMMERYEKEDRGIHIIELDNAFQMCTKKETYEYLIRIAKQPKRHVLTDVALETLSIIAYKQPITKLEIEKIRGVKSDHAVNKLIEYDLVTEVGRLNAPGKPILFGTTEEFLRRFSVQSVEELPSINPEKLEDFKAEKMRYSFGLTSKRRIDVSHTAYTEQKDSRWRQRETCIGSCMDMDASL